MCVSLWNGLSHAANFYLLFWSCERLWWGMIKVVWRLGSLLETPKQWWGHRGTRFFFHFLFFLIFTTFCQSSSPITQPLGTFPILKFPQSFRCSQFHNAQMLSFGPLPPSNLELSFITFLWSWEWKRWDKGKRGGERESNMAAYLEDFLYWNMCKQFTHKGLK